MLSQPYWDTEIIIMCVYEKGCANMHSLGITALAAGTALTQPQNDSEDK